MARQLGPYFRDLTRADNEVLDREEERKLTRRVADGDQQAKEKLVEHNLRLVVNVVKGYRGLGLDYADLIQAGNLGLMKATERFDPELGNKFSTYAYWWIRQSVLRALDQESRTVRVPAQVSKLKRKVGKLTRDHKLQQGDKPSPEDLAEKVDASEERIRRAIRTGNRTKSLDKPLGGGKKGATLAEIVEGSRSYSPQENRKSELARERLYRLMEEELSDREERILKLRYGLEDYQPRTLGEVGEVFGVSRERIRQLQERALEKLKGCELARDAARNI